MYTLVLQSTVVFSSLLLSVDGVSAQTTNSPEQRLAQLSTDSQIQTQVKSEVERAVGGTQILLGFSLVILIAFPVTVVALFWFLRRAVIREIVDRAIAQIQELENLQVQLTKVKETAENNIKQAKNITDELTREVGVLQHQIHKEQDNLAVVSSDVADEKKNYWLSCQHKFRNLNKQ